MNDAGLPGRGRPRSEQSRRAVLDATLELLAQDGYSALTLERIAVRAGVGRQTLYRWWGSKGAIVAECLENHPLLPPEIPVPNTGDLRVDLTVWMTAYVRMITDSDSSAIVRSLIASSMDSDEVARTLVDGIVSPYRAALIRRMSDGEDARTMVSDLADALLGVVVLRIILRSREPVSIFLMVDMVMGRLDSDVRDPSLSLRDARS